MNSLNEQDIFKEVEETLIQCNLQWTLQRCFTTGGGENTCGAEKGPVRQM